MEGVVVRYARLGLGHFALGAREWNEIVLLLIVIVVECREE